MDWMESSKEYIGQYFKQTELIVAADIIYDDTLFDSLLTTLRMLFNHCDNVSRFVLVNAVRNPDTEAQFLRMLGKKELSENALVRLDLFRFYSFI